MNFHSNSPMFAYNRAYKPFLYPWAVDLTVEHERMHWIEEEVDLVDDVADWKAAGRMKPEEKNFITQILRMFTQSDVNVGRFYLDYLIPTFKNNEIRNMLSSFATREGIHQRAYALLNDTLGLPEGDYATFLEYEEMAEKSDFMLDADPNTDRGLALALAKSVINEGISLFASFVMLLSFQRRGLMKGMGKVVEWSTKDETKHCEGIARLFRSYANEHPHIVDDDFKKKIYDMHRVAVELEDKFIDLAYAMGPIEGLEADDVKTYIRFVADRRLVQLGLKPNWNIEKNPLGWIDWVLNGAGHTNFFEQKVADYEIGSLNGEWGYGLVSVRIYTKDLCPYCAKAKALLDQEGIIYEVVDLTDDAERQAFYAERGFRATAGTNTVPKIYDTTEGVERLIGGYSDLSRRISQSSQAA